MIAAGNLRHRVTVQKSTITLDGVGSQTVTWSDVAPPMWVEILPFTGREQFSADAMQAEVSHVISARYQALFADPKAVAAMRIVAVRNGVTRIFNIHACMNVDELNAEVRLLCSEGLNSG
jgi:SPP1 family predicted phage head-tail adaptor